MTQKELLYVEDAVGHEDIMIKVLQESISMLEDENLVTFLEKELKQHENFKSKLMKKLEEDANE